MPTLDTTALFNWIISGLIGLIFGSIGAWYTHRLQIKRENLAWQREKEKLQERFEQEKSLLEIQFNQKLLELEKQATQQQSNQVRTEILKGVENPEEVISRYKKYQELLTNLKPGNLIARMMDTSFDKETMSKLEEMLSKEYPKRLEALEISVDELKKALDSGDITEQKFEEALGELIEKIMSQK